MLCGMSKLIQSLNYAYLPLSCMVLASYTMSIAANPKLHTICMEHIPILTKYLIVNLVTKDNKYKQTKTMGTIKANSYNLLQ